jgi:4-aminobutyrate aminotransferase-like enzyme
MDIFDDALTRATATLERVAHLNAKYRAGEVRVHVPEALCDGSRSLDDLIERHLPASDAALEAAGRGLFFSLPVAFNPAESVGPYLAAIDRDAAGEPYRFLDMGALIATQAFGENEPAVVRAVLESLPFVASRYAHSEYQTVLSLRLKAALNRIAPAGTPRHFIVNTGAEAVENAIKSVLMNRVMTSPDGDGGFIVSFDGAFHGRTLGALAVTHRKKARLGFPTFDWPHIPFPIEDTRAPRDTLRREDRTLKQLWDLLVSGRMPKAEKSKDTYRREMDAIDDFLAHPNMNISGVTSFVLAERANLNPDVVRRSRRVAAVLVEPIQGEGGVRMTSARFMRKLRLLTRIYDVPLIFDEVQTGWGMTGRLWAHELFDLPCPPDVVTWAKKAQNGVLFVSEELATFFQEEKKFNTTWEGDSVGMIRLLALMERLDLDEVGRTGQRARSGLEALAREFREILTGVRGAGVMLGFDVMRADLCEALHDRAFRRGLLLLRAGERTVRFYPRYDTEPATIDEALSILRLAVEDLVGTAVVPEATTSTPGVKTRAGTLAIPIETVEIVDLTAGTFETCRLQVLAVEQERYGGAAQYPPDVLRAGRRPLLQFPLDTLAATVASGRAIGMALRDRVSGRIVGFALGSALENHSEEGVSVDPHLGENNTFYLQAMATLPTVQNAVELENCLLESLRARAMAAGFEFLSTLIEDRVRETGPAWFQSAAVLERIDNYLRSGSAFAYLQVALQPEAEPVASGPN